MNKKSRAPASAPRDCTEYFSLMYRLQGTQTLALLNLIKSYISSLLPHILGKVNRVHYGLLRPHELEYMAANGTLPRTRRFLAVPFVGKAAPSLSSE